MDTNLRELMRVSEWGVLPGAVNDSLSANELGLYRNACAAIGERLGLGRTLVTATSDDRRALFVVERDRDALVLEGAPSPDRLGDQLHLVHAFKSQEHAP